MQMLHVDASVLVAAALTLLFVIFLFYTPVMVRWWVMLPMALIAFVIFRIKRDMAEGLEKKICDWGHWIIIIAFLLRDMCLSSRLAGMYSDLAGAKSTLQAMLGY